MPVIRAATRFGQRHIHHLLPNNGHKFGPKQDGSIYVHSEQMKFRVPRVDTHIREQNTQKKSIIETRIKIVF
jgi:hypothetical protein